MHNSSTWFVNEDILCIRNENGEIFTPTASEIFSLITGKTESIRGLYPQLLMLTGTETVNFSRYPVELYICIQTSSIDNKPVINVEILAEIGIDRVNIPDITTRIADHILFKDTWYPFVKGSLEEIRRILNNASISGTGSVTLRQYFDLRKQISETGLIRDYSEAQLKASEVSRLFRSGPETINLSIRLYPYQADGYRWLSWMASQGIGCILADEMGLGKTPQIIALLTERAKKFGPSLVIVPATLLENWRREIVKFSPGLKVLIHSGPGRTGFPSKMQSYDAVVTSYGIAVNDQILFSMTRWDIVAVDEAQAIRNPDADRTLHIKQIPHNIAIAVTGTPLETRLLDIWSLMDFVMPKYLGSREYFENKYLSNLESAKRIETVISPLILRRRVEEVAGDLPELIDIPQPLIMPVSEANTYDAIRTKMLEIYGPMGGLVATGQLAMFCAHPLVSGSALPGDIADQSTKYTRLLEVLDEIFSLRHKVLIFTTYQKMVDIFVEDLPHRYDGIFLDWIDGRVLIRRRQAIVDNFNGYPGPGALILNPNAAGVGMNITGARHVVHYNGQWNPAVQDQATARAYRLGQKYPVTVHRFYYIDTVEQVMEERIDYRRQIAGRAVIGVDGSVIDETDLMKALQISPVREVKK